MKSIRNFFILSVNLLFVLSFVFLYGCGPKSPQVSDDNTILIGTIAGPETDLVEVAKTVAKNKYNLAVYVVPFNDYVEPNRALAEGEINANMFQHQPYLDEMIASQKLKLVSIGSVFIYPMGIYSGKYKKITEVSDGAVVAIPNDASNQARSLLLLQKAGLIQLKTGDAVSTSIHEIISNPKKLKFHEVDPASMARMLPDLDLAVINTNYAVVAGLLPNRDALIEEDKESKYANIVAVRAEDKNQDKFKRLMQALRSPEVMAKARELFNDQAIKAW